MNRKMVNRNWAGILAVFVLTGLASCKDDGTDVEPDSDVVVEVDPNNFVAADVTITKVSCTLSDGTSSQCYQIVTKSAPSDHEMGPWCPSTITDDASKGGIWLSDGTVYDVDGAFVKNMATFYKDSNWMMYDASGETVN